MSTITFLSADLDEKKIKFDLDQKMKDVCKRYADEINVNIKHLVFYSNGKKLHKKMTVSEFNKTNLEKELYVVLMDEDINSESEEEKAKSINLKKEILDYIKNPEKKITYEKSKELITQYGFDCSKRIEKEKKEHPENFIEIEEAIKNKDKNDKLYAIGQLGKALENMGIKVSINKQEGKNNDDDIIIVNQFISSGILHDKRYEIHIDENDINKKYAIINNENGEQEKFIDEFKEFISKKISFPKQDIIIANVREGSVGMDVIPKKGQDLFREKIINLSKEKTIKKIYEKNILEACLLTTDMLDKLGDRDPSEWPISEQIRGNIAYHPPTKEWIGFGLKVLNQYDNGNNDWITMNNNPNEWAVAFHGTSSKAIKPICQKGGKFYSTIEEGAIRQLYKDYRNINQKSQDKYPKCNEGAYVSPYLDYADYYSGQNHSNVVIMCRVNPKEIRIPEGQDIEKIWVTDGTRNTIRPYRILVKIK